MKEVPLTKNAGDELVFHATGIVVYCTRSYLGGASLSWFSSALDPGVGGLGSSPGRGTLCCVLGQELLL